MKEVEYEKIYRISRRMGKHLDYDDEWLTQTQYEVVDGLISKDILEEISRLIWLDYNNSYSVELENDEIW